MPDAGLAQAHDPSFEAKRRSILWSIPGLLVLLSAYVPLCRQLTANDIDWPVLLDDLHLRGASFGREVAFTFGPWGFTWAATHPKTLPVACILWAGIGFVVWLALLQIARIVQPHSPLRAGAIVLLLALPLGGDYVIAPDVRLLVLPFIVLLQHFFVPTRPQNPAKMAAILALALAGMIKFTCFIAGGLVVGLITLHQLFHRERRLIPMLVWMGGIILAWLAAGQNPIDLLAYIRHSLSTTSGYADVMSLRAVDESRQVLAFCIPAMFFMVLNRQAIARAFPREWLLPFLGQFLLLLLCFRCGFVRHDVHELTATVLLLEVTLLSFVIAWPRFRGIREKIAWVLCLFVTGLTVSQSLADWHGSSLPREIARTFQNFSDETIELANLLRGRQSMIVAQLQQRLDEFKASDPLPRVQGSADLYPRLPVILLANGIHYSPRPGLQSYAATTPLLTSLDAAHLTGTDPPEHLFISPFPASEHLPTLLENRSWPQILSHYQLLGSEGNYLHLTRRSRPRTVGIEMISEQTFQLGQRLELPADLVQGTDMLWAQIDVDRTFFGSFMAQIYKPPRLFLSVVTANGQTQRWRFIPSLGADGFLLGPILSDPATFSAALSDSPDRAVLEAAMPRSIVLTVSSDLQGYSNYRSAVRIRLSRLRIEPPPGG